MERYEKPKLTHYDNLILKGLSHKGGSSSETYVYKLLTADIEEGNKSIQYMWDYLDIELQNKLIVIFNETQNLDLFDMDNKQIVKTITQHCAKRMGWKIFAKYEESRLRALSDEEYDREWAKGIKAARAILDSNAHLVAKNA